MPEPAAHESWGREMFQEAERLRTGRHERWASVAYFYCAMHLIHAALPGMTDVPTAQQHPESHSGRDGTNTTVREHIPDLYIPYKSLFTTSIAVRYWGGRVAGEMVDRHRFADLPPIGTWVCTQVHGWACDCWMRGL